VVMTSLIRVIDQTFIASLSPLNTPPFAANLQSRRTMALSSRSRVVAGPVLPRTHAGSGS